MYKPNKNFYKFLCASLMFVCFNISQTYAEKACDKGYYVESCSGYQIGTNWLKGFYQDAENHSDRSPNFYDYSMVHNMDNLRAFFAGTETLDYTTHNNQHKYATPTGGSITDPSYKQYRDFLLQTYCPNKNAATCKKCPNGGKTEASYISANEWNIQIIADCYISKYTDSTGSYEYIENTSTPVPVPVRCFYTTEILGDFFIPDSELFADPQMQEEEQIQVNN